jgi:hypothetical protein
MENIFWLTFLKILSKDVERTTASSIAFSQSALVE